jgi:hypothetical protein
MKGCVVFPTLNRPMESKRCLDSLEGESVFVSYETVPRCLYSIWNELLLKGFEAGNDFVTIFSDNLVAMPGFLSEVSSMFQLNGLDCVLKFRG